MPRNLKLTQRGLILVACPLVLELILVASLSWLITEEENQASRLDRYRTILARASNVIELYYSSINCLTLYCVKKDPIIGAKYAALTTQITEELDDLMDAAQSDARQRLALAKVTVLLERGLKVLDEVRQEADTDGIRGIKMVALTIKSNKAGGQTMSAMHEFTRAVKDTERITPEGAEHLRNCLKICLAVAAAIAIGFIVISLFFYNGLTRRLGTLLDNTVRLTAGKSLNAPLGGGDEVGRLDNVFHEMATALEEASRKERAIVDNAVDVICTIDTEGNFIRVNPAVTAIFGYEPEALTGRPLRQMMSPSEHDKAQSHLEQLKESNASSSFEVRIERHDGKPADILWSAHWSQSDKCWFCVAHDISDRKEVEQLRQQFVSMVSHDLRTPLNSVQMFFDLLNDGAYGEVDNLLLSRSQLAETNIDRLIRLVNDLLDTEKIAAGRLTMNCRSVEVDTLVQSALNAVSGFALQQQVGLSGEPAELRVFVDPDRIVQVLVNLLGNAIKFSPPEGKVTVAAERIDDQVEIRVQDQCRGIPEAHKHLIFDKFEQVESEDSTVKGGAGLGLSISKAIIQAHGGTIGVTSKEGKGSTFWLRVAPG